VAHSEAELNLQRYNRVECLHKRDSIGNSQLDQLIIKQKKETFEVISGFEMQNRYSVQNSTGQQVFFAREYRAAAAVGLHNPSDLRSHDGSTEVGRVSKQWTNLLQEYFTDVDNFGITFPRDLSVKIKAVVLAACFL
uniref:Phospholipid scramblase n=1 Tax=Macrostomum lignano TaxID=282301 RepID=A0A1I8GR61_9PLAT